MPCTLPLRNPVELVVYPGSSCTIDPVTPWDGQTCCDLDQTMVILSVYRTEMVVHPARLTNRFRVESLSVVKHNLGTFKVPGVDNRRVFGLQMAVKSERLFGHMERVTSLEGNDNGERLHVARQD
jgi:hypothetical protein